jgi:polyphosphate kinase
MRQIILSLALIASAVPALAHPHMFMDTSLQVRLDSSGAVAAVQITWAYDELSSLQYIADLGLDMDGDGVLTADEKAVLSGFDMNWDAGFAGDSYVLVGGVDVPLSRPRDFSADYVDGKIISVHVRDLAVPAPVGPDAGPMAGGDVVVQVYDPGFYAAYTVQAAAVTGPDGAPALACAAQIFVPDLTAADQILLDALAEYTVDENVEDNFPAVGAAYAEEVRITCGA